MKTESTWKDFWEAKHASRASNVEVDRGTSARDDLLDRLATEELVEFIRPESADIVFDAGCGTGANCVLIHERVRKVIAVDFAESAVTRGMARLRAAGVKNVMMSQGDITDVDLVDHSVDKVLCLSVFQYLSDDQIRACLRSFARVLKRGGVLIIHVKNLASLYAASLYTVKRFLRLLGRQKAIDDRARTFEWYVRELAAAGFEVEHFNSFNLLIIDRMPARVTRFIQTWELSQRDQFPLNSAFLRRHGADLKIRARLRF